MTNFEVKSYSDAELAAEFERLFPHGFAGQDVITELAPEGWQSSPLKAVFHPSPAQLFDEALRMHQNLISLRKPDDSRRASPSLTLEQITQEFRERPVDTEVEVRELVGKCLWDIFSDNHEVVGPDGRALDTGSFRGSGAFLAEFLNRQIGREQYDYMSFYMGTSWGSQRADVTPVYRMIFRRLHARGLDWTYHFPRIFAFDFRPLKKALDQKDNPQWTDYDPSKALEQEEADRKQDEELAEFRESLDEGHREAVHESLKGPPPATVQAYEAVYGRLPRGWPPSAIQ